MNNPGSNNMKKKIPFVFMGEYQEFDDFAKKNARTYAERCRSQGVHAESPVDACRRFGIGNGARIFTDMWGLSEKELDDLLSKTDFIQVDFFRLTNGPLHSLDLVLRKMREHGVKLWGCPFGETDNNGWWLNHPGNFRTRREAAQWYKKWLLNEACICAGSFARPQRKKSFRLRDFKSKLLPGGNVAEYIRKGCPDRMLNLVIQCGFTMLVHEYFEYGANAVAMERNICLGNIQIGAAFLRGAARQYDGAWMFDLSAWAQMPSRKVHLWYDSKGRRQDGYSESLWEREYMASYLSGCDNVLTEVSNVGYWRQGTKKRVLSPLGKKARVFSEFALRRHRDRGEAVTPVALLMDHYNGWQQPVFDHEHLVWGNKVPFESGDYMIEAFFDVAFPGYRQASRGGFMKNFNPDFPYRSSREFMQAFERGVDMRPYELGHLTPSRWGDIFDVITDHAPVDVLKRYPVVFLLGTIKLTPALRRKLQRYVESGGILILNSQNLPTVDDEVWAGYRNKGASYEKQPNVVWDGESKIHYEGYVAYTIAEPLPGVRVLARDIETIPPDTRLSAVPCPPSPMALSRKVGKGSILTFLPWHCHPIDSRKILDFVVAGLDHIIKPFLPAIVQGPPAEIIFNRPDANRFWVGIINHSGESWKGTITPVQKFARCRDIWREQELAVSSGKVTVRLKPYGFAVVEFQMGRKDIGGDGKRS